MFANALPACGLTLTSPDLRNGGTVPLAFTLNAFGCTGQNQSPRLVWSAVPMGTKSFALTMIDSDAAKPGGFVHWIVLAIPASARRIAKSLPPSAVAGLNDFGERAYGGPCPPPGDPPHHYHITLAALDATISGRTYADYLHERRGHVLATAQINVRFGR